MSEHVEYQNGPWLAIRAIMDDGGQAHYVQRENDDSFDIGAETADAAVRIVDCLAENAI